LLGAQNGEGHNSQRLHGTADQVERVIGSVDCVGLLPIAVLIKEAAKDQNL
jgi:hypothetical protein